MPTNATFAASPVIESRQNSRVKQLRAAMSGSGRHGGLVAIEGEHLLGEALRSGLELETVFVREGRESLVEKLGVKAGTQVAVLSDDVFLAVAATEHSQGVAALLRPKQFKREALLGNAGSAPLVLVAAGLQDPGNMGTLVRSAEAFGATGVLALAGTVNVWNQKALRASAGSTFRVPVVAGTVEDLRWLRASGVKLLAAVAEEGATAVGIDLRGGIALLIGNEGAGLTDEVRELADGRITVPCPGPVESLNAAVAGSLLLYEAARQRSSVGAEKLNTSTKPIVSSGEPSSGYATKTN